ncbi:hypothetical protein [Streptomyces zagrosensis]|uniref:Uncharacterized protein n=1 Tax=Streptomyces zagrosensis TaxID=1042984 RepID=A0A7W9UYQ5_9ACTN|nr:hypothetical protein [Streptomyces zagrosensis]MBB5936195.1 hypothetical protein [Streptomyces zagrosensis]
MISARHLTLTGQHAVRLSNGATLRFFLADASTHAEVGTGTGTSTSTSTNASDPVCGWEQVTDIEFQLAYETALFDPDELEHGNLRPNPHRVQLTLDALAGPGAFCWLDGADKAGLMTNNGKTPEECGLDLAEIRRNTEGAS